MISHRRGRALPFVLSRITFAVALCALTLNPLAPATAASSGVFRVTCKFSHRAMADPIMSPGQTSGHLHDFFGNDTTNKDSTYKSMVGKSTSCAVSTDTAAFWAPTLLDKDDNPVPILKAAVYYRDIPQPSKMVIPFPPDFRIIAGFPHRQEAKPRGFWGWNCDDSEPLQPTSKIDCTGHSETNVRASVFFPECGKLDANGHIVTDSRNHRSHAAYADDETGCPRTYPVKLPTLNIKITYEITDCVAARCHLSSDGQTIEGKTCSDPGCTLHADFWNTWVQGPASKRDTLRNLVKTCLNAEPEKECSF